MTTVLHVIESLSEYGGTPRLLLNLVAASAGTGVRHDFFVYQPSPLRDEFAAHGATVQEIGSRSLSAILSEVWGAIRRVRPDVIATHFSRPLIAGFVVASCARLPLVHHEHSSPAYRRGLAKCLATTLEARAEAVICVSEHIAVAVRDDLRGAPARVIPWYPPVAARLQERSRASVRSELGLDDAAPLIAHVGGMIPERDQATLVNALPLLLRAHPSAVLVMVGEGPCRRSLEDLAALLRVEKSIRFMGYSNHVGDLMAACDVYVNPTRDEGLGLAVVEAMLAGAPVVVTDAGAHPEYVTDQLDGRLVPPGDSTSLAAAILATLSDSGTRLRAFRAKQRAEARFGPSHAAWNYAEIIRSVCSRTAVPPLQL